MIAALLLVILCEVPSIIILREMTHVKCEKCTFGYLQASNFML